MGILQSTPLSADAIKVRWKEPYLSAALNQKLLGTMPKGVATGFTVIPSGAVGVTLALDSNGLSIANVRETTGGLFCVTLVLNTTVTLDLTAQAGTTCYIALDAQYTFGASAAQVKVVDVAELTAPAGADLVLLAKVNVPGVGNVTTSHINMGYRDASGDSMPFEAFPHFNLIHNSTFEATAAGWTNNGFTSLAASTDFAKTGGYSLKLVRAGAATVFVNTGPMPVGPTRTYRVAAWLHSPAGLTGGNGAKLQVGWYDAAGAQIGGWVDVEAAVAAATAAFVVRKSEVTAPALALTAAVRVLFDNCSGTLYVDDVSFASHTHDEVMKSAVFGGPGVSGDAYHTHTGAGLAYGGGANWADGSTNPATTVEAQLDKILTDLGVTSGVGASKISYTPVTPVDLAGIVRVDTALNTLDDLKAGINIANIFSRQNTFNNTGTANASAITATGNGSGAGVYAQGGANGFAVGTGLVAVGGDGVPGDTVGGTGITATGGNGGSGDQNGGIGISATGGNGGGGGDGASGGVFTGGAAAGSVAGNGGVFTGGAGVFGGAGGVFTGGAGSFTGGVGGVFSGAGGAASIDATSGKIVNVANPTAAQDAATKSYVDANAGTALNTVINGGFEYWQRGTLVTSAISLGASATGYNFHGYCADRWYAQTRDDSGGNPIDVDIRPFTVTGLNDTRRAIRIRNNQGGAFSQFYQVVQELDRDTVVRLRGKKLSWRVAVRKGTSSPNNTDFFCEVYSNTGAASERIEFYTGAAVVGGVSASGGSLSSANFTYFTVTSAAVIPAGVNGISIVVGSYQNGGGPGDANDYMEFGEVSVVAGEAAPNKFGWAGGDLNTELNMCERYYEKSYDTAIGPATSTFNGLNLVPVSSLGALASIPFRTSKRVVPTVTFWRSTGASNAWEHAGGTTGMNTLAIGTSSFLPSKDDTPNAVTANTTVSGHWVADAEI